MTYLELNRLIINARETVRALEMKQMHLPGIHYIRGAENNCELLEEPSDALVRELQQRDYPMSENMIREIFEASGWKYSEEQIKDCRPESRKQVSEYLDEQRGSY